MQMILSLISILTAKMAHQKTRMVIISEMRGDMISLLRNCF